MRRALWSTFLVVALLLTVAAGATRSAARASSHRSVARAQTRVWKIAIQTPAPPDYALAQIDLAVPGSTPVGVRALEPFGADYIAAAKASATEGRLRILALVLDRATNLMDPTTVHLSLRLPKTVGGPKTIQVRDGLVARQGPPPALCDLQAGSEGLDTEGLQRLLSVGAPLSSFSPLQTIAQGYDLSCGLDFQTGFEEQVRGVSAPAPTSPGCPPCTPNTVCTPCTSSPSPCAPCDPLPAHACPMTAQPAICVASREALARAGDGPLIG